MSEQNEQIKEEHALQESHIKSFLNDIKQHFDGKPLSAEQLADIPSGYREGLTNDAGGHGQVISHALDVIRDHQEGHPHHDRLRDVMKEWNPEGSMSGREFVSSKLKEALPEMKRPEASKPEEKKPEGPEEKKPEGAEAKKQESPEEKKPEGPSQKEASPSHKEEPEKAAAPNDPGHEEEQARRAAEQQKAYEAGISEGRRAAPTHNSSSNTDLLGLGKVATGLGNAAVDGIRTTFDAATTSVGRGVDKIGQGVSKVAQYIHERRQKAVQNVQEVTEVANNQRTPSKPMPDFINKANESTRNKAGEDFMRYASDAREAIKNKDQKKLDEAYDKMGLSLGDEMKKDSEIVKGKGAEKLSEKDGKEIIDRYTQREADINTINKQAEENGLTPRKEMQEGLEQAMKAWKEALEKMIKAIIERVRGVKQTMERTQENTPSV